METFPHLASILQLVDDESPVVQKAVEKKLLTYGEAFWQAFYAGELPVPPKSPQSRALKQLRKSIRRQVLRDHWLEWRRLEEDDETARLESGLSLLGAYLSKDQPWYAPLTELLDNSAEDYLKLHSGTKPDVLALAKWLFSSQNGRIAGNQEKYYEVQNSNAVWVLRHGMGTPLALCAIYEMVARRLGLEVAGSNFPGHFYSRIHHPETGEDKIVDCFHGGGIMDPEDVISQSGHDETGLLMRILLTRADADSMIARTLRNLAEAFSRKNCDDEREFMTELGARMITL